MGAALSRHFTVKIMYKIYTLSFSSSVIFACNCCDVARNRAVANFPQILCLKMSSKFKSLTYFSYVCCIEAIFTHYNKKNRPCKPCSLIF